MSYFYVWCLFLLSGCSQTTDESTSFSGNAMTIDYHITVGQSLNASEKKKVEQLVAEVFYKIDSIFNKWNAGSEISIINKLDKDTIHTLSPDLANLFMRIDGFVKLSEGRFDPTVEPLEKLWKVHLEKGLEPSSDSINNISHCIGWDKFIIQNNSLYKLEQSSQIDLGGIAKGLCVDMIVEKLTEAGFSNLFVEWGGDIRAIGNHPSKRPWRLYIAHPENSDPNKAVAELPLNNQAIATSGDYFQFWMIENENQQRTYCHIFDPLKLRPLEVTHGSIASASLLANDCVTADALAKVLMLFDTQEEAKNWFIKVQEKHPEMNCWIVTRP